MAWMVWAKVLASGTQAMSDLRLPPVWFTSIAAAGAVAAGLMAVVFYFAVVQFIGWRNAAHMPLGEPHTWAERWASLRAVRAVLLLFGFVLGGIYGGPFTLQEAAGIGAAGALVIGLLRGRLHGARSARR